MSSYRTKQFEENVMGKFGAKRVTTTSETTPDEGKIFVAIKALAETTINTTTGNITGFDGAVISQGDVVVGEFTSVTLTSGDAILYMGV